MAGHFGDLLVIGLILLEDSDQRLGRPKLVGGELALDVEEDIFLGVVHRANKVAQIYKKSRTILKKVKRVVRSWPSVDRNCQNCAYVLKSDAFRKFLQELNFSQCVKSSTLKLEQSSSSLFFPNRNIH
jgi:hypothetical protein